MALSSSKFLFLPEPQDLLILALCPRFPCTSLFISGSACRELRGCTPGTAQVWGTPETLQQHPVSSVLSLSQRGSKVKLTSLAPLIFLG